MSNACNYMPSAEDFIMLILGVSQSLCSGRWLPGRKTYDKFKPCGWPTALELLAECDYRPTTEGWREFLIDTVGGHCTIHYYHVAPKIPPTPPGPSWGDELALTLCYEWPWNGARERRDAIARGWV